MDKIRNFCIIAHIDHGKSALVKALTGTDPDRLAEEKRRGITIQLGFARIELPDVQAATIKALKQRTGKPVIVVLCTGSAIALGDAADYADAILVAWYGGEEMGRALFEVIADCSDGAIFGRLPVTFYASTSQLPSFGDYAMRGRTYRYMTATPAFPFGYGLTYNSRHELQNLKYDAATRSVTGLLRVEGNPHEEVVQVYLKGDGTAARPLKTLVGFVRIDERVSSNEAAFSGRFYRHDVVFSVPINYEALREYDMAAGRFKYPPQGTRYKLLVGFSSDDSDLQEIEMVY